MPGLYDVLATIRTQVATACYPNGILSPSITTRQISVESPAPIRSQEDFDLSAGNSHVYVDPNTGFERVVTKFPRTYTPMIQSAATIVLTVGYQTVTITGIVSVPQAVMIINNGIGYGYSISIADTLTTIASNLASLIPGASSVGNVVSIPGSHSLTASIATNYTASVELSRVERIFDIVIVSPTPADRQTILEAVNNYMLLNYRVVGSDDYYLLLFYHSMPVTDDLEKSRVYKATLKYLVNYPTTSTSNFTTITNPFINSFEVKWQ